MKFLEKVHELNESMLPRETNKQANIKTNGLSLVMQHVTTMIIQL